MWQMIVLLLFCAIVGFALCWIFIKKKELSSLLKWG